MILFVFEGAEREPRIFKTLERLFFGRTMLNCRQALNRQISLKSIFSLTTISRILICRLSTATQS